MKKPGGAASCNEIDVQAEGFSDAVSVLNIGGAPGRASQSGADGCSQLVDDGRDALLAH